MATFVKHKVKDSGATLYRQANGGRVSVAFPASAFEGEAPNTVEIGAAGLAAPGAKPMRAVNQAVVEARAVLAKAREDRKAALADRLARMTPAQREKREANLAKMKARVAAKKNAA